MTKENLKVGDTVYNEQGRWFDYDYHPQIIQEIKEEEIVVFEEGYFPKGKTFHVAISSLREKVWSNGETWIIH